MRKFLRNVYAHSICLCLFHRRRPQLNYCNDAVAEDILKIYPLTKVFEFVSMEYGAQLGVGDLEASWPIHETWVLTYKYLSCHVLESNNIFVSLSGILPVWSRV